MALRKQHIKGYPATLFIPDISGFTEFVDETEITHSRHIIAELLELLIDTDDLGLSISEIEGDAILFYKYGAAPPLQAVVKQAQNMFVAFHGHLQRYERDRMCDCRACSSTKRLTLKIVVHYGTIASVDIKSFHKLFGRELIVVHRLMKNDIRSSEYVLLTVDYLDNQEDSLEGLKAVFSWLSFRSAASVYSVVGEVAYRYFTLTSLRSTLPEIPEREPPKKYKHRLSVQQLTINAPLALVYDYLTDLTRRHHWMKRARNVELDNRLTRVGTSHLCFLPAMTLDIKISANAFEKGHVEYVEEVTNIPMVPRANVFSVLEEIDEKEVLFSVEVYYQRSFWGVIMAPLLRIVMRNQFSSNAQLFKHVVERAYSHASRAHNERVR